MMESLFLRPADASLVARGMQSVFGVRPISGKAKLVWIAFMVTFFALNVYLFYRYALQINSAKTSPTYSNTPATLQAGKYVIAYASLVLCCLLCARDFKLRALEGVLLLTMVAALGLAMVHSEVALWVKVFAVIPPAYIAYLVMDGADKRRSLVCICAVLVVLHVGYETFQVVSYRVSGRLPALAYANGGLVRFGGGWDDPNGFGVCLCLPIAYLLHAMFAGHGRKRTHVVLLVAVLACAALTVSFSAYVCYIIVAAVIAVVFRNRGAIWISLSLVIIALTALLVLFFGPIADILQGKSGSLQAHSRFSILTTIEKGNAVSLLVGLGGSFSENFYDYMLQAYGIGIVGVLTIAQVYLAWVSGKNALRYKGDSFLFATAVFLGVMPVAQAMIPHMAVFPVNYLYWCFAFMHLRCYRDEHDDRRCLMHR